MSEQSVKKRNGPGRPKDPAKRAAILEAAKRMFIALGYEGCSMDAIAAEAGVSKLTVYSHFTDKDSLFASAIAAKCQESLPAPLFERSAGAPLEQVLSEVAQRYVELTRSQETLAVYRLLIAQSEQNPALSNMLFEAGPVRILESLTQLLSQANSQGELKVEHPRWSAEQFLSMLQSLYHVRALIGSKDIPSGAALQQHIERVVANFLMIHRP